MFNLLINNSLSYLTHVIAAFTFLSAGWLYVDAWNANRKIRTPLVRAGGFLLLFASYLVMAAPVVATEILTLLQAIKIVGYTIIFLSLAREPILKVPVDHKRIKLHSLVYPWVIAGLVAQLAVQLLIAIASGAVAVMYYIKATRGLEKQLGRAGVAFGFFFLSELVRLPLLYSGTKIVFWSQLLAQFGTVWYVATLLELAGAAILFWWVIGYFRFRLQSQLFVITLRLIIPLFLATTISFSYLTLTNLERDLLTSLKTDTRLFQYTLERQQLEALASARTIAVDKLVIDNPDQPNPQIREFFESIANVQRLDSIALVNLDGRVVTSAEETEYDISLLDDPLFVSAKSGNPLSTIVAKNMGPTPRIIIEAAVPVVKNDSVIGVVKTGYVIDQSFVDGIKEVTGLDVSLFAGDTRAATTLTYEDGTTHFVGTRETNPVILDHVLKSGRGYSGKNQVHTTTRYVSYEPLRGIGGVTIGMLSSSLPENILRDNLVESSNLTFLISLLIITGSIIPIYFLSRRIANNITA